MILVNLLVVVLDFGRFSRTRTERTSAFQNALRNFPIACAVDPYPDSAIHPIFETGQSSYNVLSKTNYGEQLLRMKNNEWK